MHNNSLILMAYSQIHVANAQKIYFNLFDSPSNSENFDSLFQLYKISILLLLFLCFYLLQFQVINTCIKISSKVALF